MINLIARIMFKLSGWKIIGKAPREINKCVLVGAPHTSNYDFIYALAALNFLKLPIKYLIKNEWLKKPLLSSLFTSSGAVGVNRKQNNTMVEALADLIVRSKEDIYLLVTPEGTRKKRDKWKTGFYYIALQAKVPIVLTGLDYAKKEAIMGPSFMPSGCYRRDMNILKDFYQGLTPRYPDNFSLQIYFPEEEAVCSA